MACQPAVNPTCNRPPTAQFSRPLLAKKQLCVVDSSTTCKICDRPPPRTRTTTTLHRERSAIIIHRARDQRLPSTAREICDSSPPHEICDRPPPRETETALHCQHHYLCERPPPRTPLSLQLSSTEKTTISSTTSPLRSYASQPASGTIHENQPAFYMRGGPTRPALSPLPTTQTIYHI